MRAPRTGKPSRSRLRAVRLIVAALFFTSLSLLFLDIHAVLPPWAGESGLYFQFLPSLVHGMQALGAAAGGFIIVTVITLALGRVYCAAICPLGILMDIILFLKPKTGRRPGNGYAPPHRAVRYGLLAATLICFAGGSMAMITLLDPFSNFGRMTNTLARPAVILVNNGLARLMELAGNYDIPPLSLPGIHLGMAGSALGVALLVSWLALTRGRLYCNMICPVGTLLGLMGKAAPLKIRILSDTCNSCGKCERRCKAGCIDSQSGTIDHSRCVVCFNCLDACPTGAARYGICRSGPGLGSSSKGRQRHPTHTRRGFLVALATALAWVPGTSRGKSSITVTVPNKIPVPKPAHPILPPGSISLDRFTSTCTGCHACVAHCPAHVLQPAITQYGLAGLFMPFLDPASGFCNLNCRACGSICPTTAITPFSLEEKKTIQVGVVTFIRENCIVVLQKTDCGACAEHCPTKAVAMVAQGRIREPRINEKICLGCGACEHVCPAKPNKAIYVRPHRVHQKAEPAAPRPVQQPLPETTGDDFNF
ncbi:MAG: 4Fe-4S dicluster domain-containing protein [Desulfobacter sp.]|nr:MAG: 4Fe-4S dicluster domain-containing protein [Desulfobacter sp.]